MAGRARKDVPSGAQREPLQRGYARPCAAHGCPLGGTFSNATIGDADSVDWWCYLHSSLGYDYQQVTHAIRQEPELVANVSRTSMAFLEHMPNRGKCIHDYHSARDALYAAVVRRLQST